MSLIIRRAVVSRFPVFLNHLSIAAKPLRLMTVMILLLFSGALQAQSSPENASELQAIEVEPVNINQADAETIARTLVGIGQSRAEAIVVYREQYGDFHSLEELQMVRGVGEVTLKNNADRIRFE